MILSSQLIENNISSRVNVLNSSFSAAVTYCVRRERCSLHLCYNYVSSRSPLPCYRIKTLQRDYLYRWQNWGSGENWGRGPGPSL